MGAFLYFAMAGGAEFELVYVVNVAVLLIALIASIFVKSNEPKKTEIKEKSHLKTYFTELKEGFTFARRGVMMVLILMFLTVDLFASVAYVNVPMLAQVHTGEASAYILLTALALIGGLIGSYITRIIGPKFEVWKVFVGCLVLAGIARIIFVNVLPDNFTRALWIYAIYIGLGSTVGMFFGTLEQKLPPKHMVARISTITISLFGITSAFGALLGGIMGNLLPNVDMIFIIQGASYIAIGLCVCLSKRIRNLPKIDDVVSIDESANSGYN
jgi:MFS family permease